MRKTDIFILESLLKSDGAFVSGNDLAQELGISRVGVWARLEKLREDGFKVEAIRHRGYRLIEEPNYLHESLLRAHLNLTEKPVELVFRERIDSTNSEAERQLANGREAPFVCVAAEQTRGRGRLGRTWHSPAQGSIYASFAFRPQVAYPKIQSITLWLGLQLCAYLNDQWGVPAGIKWPNDLWIDGRKVAGMLTEARIDADRTRDLVFGVGVNVMGAASRFPDELQKVATTVEEHYRREQSLRMNEVAAGLIDACLKGYQGFVEGAHEDTLQGLWEQYDLLKDSEVTVSHKGEQPTGTARGITDAGLLRVELPSGELIEVSSGEVQQARPVPLG